jgi:DNA-binding transcriptional regulator YdaS (Cro superfamily)
MDEAETSPQKAELAAAAALIGGQAALARLLGYDDRRNVNPWFSTARPFPEEHCPTVEFATNGKHTCERLRPDVRWVRIADANWPHPNGRPAIDVAATLVAAQADKPAEEAHPAARAPADHPDNIFERRNDQAVDNLRRAVGEERRSSRGDRRQHRDGSSNERERGR